MEQESGTVAATRLSRFTPEYVPIAFLRARKQTHNMLSQRSAVRADSPPVARAAAPAAPILHLLRDALQYQFVLLQSGEGARVGLH